MRRSQSESAAVPGHASNNPHNSVPPRARDPLRRAFRAIEHTLVVLIILFALFIITPVSAWVYGWFDCHDELVRAKYIICLGGNANRIIESARLLQEGWAEKLIVTNHGRFADDMRDVAVEWGADPSKILIDRASHTTCDHPAAVRAAAGLDPATDVCIIVTNYTHMQRAKACFERAGYRHLILREPRWERRFRAPEESTWKARFLIFPQMLYEAAAWTEYRLRGVV